MSLLLFAIQLTAAGDGMAVEPAGPSPSEAHAAFVTPDEIVVELVACEPQVVDPVAIRFDHQGRLWVVEMRDYPRPATDGEPPQGRLRLLEDRDQDGRFETATTFADGLLFPTGVQPWKNGAIVTLAGEIRFYADEDGDQQADRHEIWFSGFAQQNEQLRANHPVLGPDGLVYIAGGLRGGTIVSRHPAWQLDEPMELQGFDFAFDPHGGFLGRVSGNSQYGLTIDDFGNRIGCSNRNPAIEAVLSYPFIATHNSLAAKDALNDAALVGPASEVRAIAKAWTTSNLHAGQFSAACGVLRGCGPGLPTSWANDLFVCEPTAYVVQRQRTSTVGPALQARRIPGIECVASKSDWFRPVDLVHGPEGSIYIADMARAVIEHPDWMPEELRNRADLRWGDQLGRIWRLRATEQVANRTASYKAPAIDENGLLHGDPWCREIASQRLYEQLVTPERVAALERLASDESALPAARARATQFLHRRSTWSPSLFEALRTAAAPELRALALRLSEGPLPTETLFTAASDPDARVRFAAAVHLVQQNAVDSNAVAALAILTRGDAADPWFAKLLGVVSAAQATAVLRYSSSDDLASLPLSLLTDWATRSAAESPTALSQFCADHPELSEGAKIALAVGWVRGLRSNRQSVADHLSSLPESQRSAIEHAFDAAVKIAIARQEAEPLRKLAMECLAHDAERAKQLSGLLRPNEYPAIRMAAMPVLMRHDRPATLSWLDQSFAALPPGVRDAAVSELLRDPKTIAWLLDRVERGDIPIALIGLSATERMKRSKDEELRKRAIAVFAAASKDRGQIVARYEAATDLRGDALQGQALFQTHCANCHRVGTIGIDVGPDISDSRTKTAAALLTSILDPNAAIDAAYLRYSLLTVDGTVWDGLLISDTGNAIVLQTQGGERRTFLKENVESTTAAGVSLMPEGFEQLISVTEMRDLLTYLKNWRYQDGSIPLGLNTR